jgi:hypothetical protein
MAEGKLVEADENMYVVYRTEAPGTCACVRKDVLIFHISRAPHDGRNTKPESET